MNDIKYTVLVRCITFNHAAYIEGAMNGFCMQRTNFPFVCVIFDDASTDGETEVIRNYVEENFDFGDNGVTYTEDTDDYLLQYVRHKINRNCYFVVVYLKYNHWQLRKNKDVYVSKWYDASKYKAECEGDDYWINPMKLQKQVDFMESHPDCFLCGSNALVLWDKGYAAPTYFRQFYETGFITPEQLIGNWLFATASVMCQIDVKKYFPEWTKKFIFSDMLTLLVALHLGNVGVIEDVTTVYRKSKDNKYSITNRNKKRMDTIYEQQAMMYEEYDKWTNGQYHDLVEKKIHFLRKDSKWCKYLYKNRFLPWLMMPLFTLKKHFGKK